MITVPDTRIDTSDRKGQVDKIQSSQLAEECYSIKTDIEGQQHCLSGSGNIKRLGHGSRGNPGCVECRSRLTIKVEIPYKRCKCRGDNIRTDWAIVGIMYAYIKCEIHRTASRTPNGQ